MGRLPAELPRADDRARARAQGLELKAAFENEFTLARREGDASRRSTAARASRPSAWTCAAPVMGEIIDALVAQGVEPEQYYAELGPGQQELPVRYTDALRAADNQLTVRETARGVALRHGLIASFAPKPFPGEAGNGSHIHFSLWRTRDGVNHFHDAEGRTASPRPRWRSWPACSRTCPALLALTAPSVNSYRRLQPRFWSSAYAAWGPGQPRGAPSACPPSGKADRGGVDQPRAQAVRPLEQPVPRARRSARRRARRHGARARSRRADARGSRRARRRAERERRGIRRHPPLSARRWTPWSATRCSPRAGPDAVQGIPAREAIGGAGFPGKDVAFELAQHFYKY